ncbi:hypothetical protein SALBM135S_04079 [Streptomyces alboniger]
MTAGPDSVAAAVDKDLAAMEELARRIAGQLGTPDAAPDAAPEAAQEAPRPAQHGPRLEVGRASGMVRGGSPESQRAHLDDLVRRYTAKTPTSKRIAQKYRGVLADSRAAVGFRSSTEEMLYRSRDGVPRAPASKTSTATATSTSPWASACSSSATSPTSSPMPSASTSRAASSSARATWRPARPRSCSPS